MLGDRKQLYINDGEKRVATGQTGFVAPAPAIVTSASGSRATSNRQKEEAVETGSKTSLATKAENNL